MNPSPLTGERLANVLECRHVFFLVNPNQRVCSTTCFWLHLVDSGPHHDCGI
ncbi:hypothetical protein ACUN3I_14580 [Hafnia alvei]|uniref:hypothetical protein n=1 Tax=Hafnia alvei TaxID=569 RepID=UPI0040450A9F